ncbi:MAG: glycosyltransferase family 2 protein [Candidatus Omnitrophica bacterium]|nr:glycosyltransferase family 2 protein [Candidatus Omnitrophota bacterium]
MPRDRISAVIITKDEEGNIARCLDSLKWVDEIVVVDGESRDRTPEIALSYGAKVITHKFESDFGLERNIGNDNASGKWIIAMDADEVLPPDTRTKIEGILDKGTDADAYNVLRKQFFLGKFMEHGGRYHRIINFFKKDKTHFEGKVHHLVKVKGTVKDADFCIEHYPFNSISQFTAKHNRYTDCEAKEMLENFGDSKYKEIRYNLTVKPIKLFIKTYIKKKGYKDGLHGLVFCLLFTWGSILKWAKYWELCENLKKQRKD